VGRLLIVALSLSTVAFAEKPGTWVEMEVWDVVRVDSGQQHVVLLRTKAAGKKGNRKVLPIWIGPAEALAIQLRMARQLPPRPLTHDLVENLLKTVGARIVKIHVEGLRERVFLGRVYVKSGDRTHDVDARPSDSIALALGASAPIFVAKKVLDEAGLDASPGVGDDAPDVGDVLRRTHWNDKDTSL